MQVASAEDRVDDRRFDVRALVQRAAREFRGGNLSEADAAYAQIVARNPEYPDAWFLYGLATMELGNLPAAIDRLRRAVTMRRAEPRYRLLLARACLAAGRTAEAVDALEAAVRLTPDAPDVNAALGRAYLSTGRPERAAACSRRAIGFTFRHLARRLVHAFACLSTPLLAAIAWPQRRTVPWQASIRCESGRIAECFRNTTRASQWYQEAAELAPGWPAPLLHLGRIAFEAEQFAASRNYLETACERAPDDPNVLAAHGRTLSRMAFHEEALDVLERARRIAPTSFAVRCQLGWTCYRAGDTHAALDHFAAALDGHPRHVDAWFGAANCHADLGDAAAARRCLDRTLALDPGHAGAFREFASLKVLSPVDDRFAALEQLAFSPKLHIHRRCILNMALGEVYRNHGDAAKAFAHYDLGNALKDVTFDIVTWRRYLDRIMRQFDAAHFARVEGMGDASDVPVFIVGMPRSGASLIEQILASHPDVHGAGEREDIGRLADTLGDVIGDDAAYPECVTRLVPEDIATLASEQLSRLRAPAPQAARITDKMPGNYRHLGLIATLFPNARIIHCRRDPLDVCLSIYFGDFAGHHPYAYNLENLGLYYREYERIMAYWSDTLPARLFEIRYQDVVDDIEGMTRRLLEFCGLPWNARCLEFHRTERTVHTRSNTQVRQPIYKNSLGRWRPYARYLEPLARALGGEEPERLRRAVAPSTSAAEHVA